MDREIVYRYGVIGLEEIQGKLSQTAETSDQAHARIKKGADDSNVGLKALDETVGALKGRVLEFSEGAGLLGEVLTSLGGGPFLAAAAAAAAFSEGLKKAIEAAADGQVRLAQINAVLSATGDVSGKTTRDLTELADKLATTTLASRDQVLQAETQLLTFRSVTGSVFDETIKLAQDLAASGFGSITENAVKLGKALENPEVGLQALTRVGIVFSEQLKDQIKDLAAHGEQLQAQELIIAEVTKRVGGAGAAGGDTLTGAWHAFGQEFGIAMEAVGERTGLLPVLQHAIEGVTGALKQYADADELARKEGELFSLTGSVNEVGGKLPGDIVGKAGYTTSNQQAHIDALKEEIAEIKLAREVDQALADQRKSNADQDAAIDGLKSKTLARLADDTSKYYDELLADAAAGLQASQKEWEAMDAEQKKREQLIEQLGIESDARGRMLEATTEGKDAVADLNTQLEVESNLRKAGADATDLDIAQIRTQTILKQGAIEAQKTYNDTKALEAKVFAEVDAQEQKSADEAAKRLQKQIDDEAKAVQKMAVDMGSHVVDALINMAEGAKKPFDSLLQYAKHIFEQVVAAATLNPIILPVIVSAIGGIGGGGAAGALATGGSIASLAGQSGLVSLGGLSLGGAIDSGGYALGIGGTTSIDASTGMFSVSPYLSSYLGAAAIGGGLGYGFGALTGGNKTISSIGGTAAGVALMAGQPEIAAAIAAISAIGSLIFGPGQSDKLEGDWINFSSGQLTPYGYSGAKYSQDNANQASQLASSLTGFAGILTTAGLSPNYATNARVEVGDRGAPYRVWYGGINGDQSNGQFQTAQEAFQAMAQQLINSLGTVPADVQKAIDNIDWSNLKGFADQLNEIAAFHQTLANVHQQLEQLKNPQQAELDALNAQFQPVLDEANKLGEDTAEIQELWDLKKKQITDKYAAQVTVTVDNTTQEVVSAVADWSSITGQYYATQLNSLQAQLQAAQQLSDTWANIRDSLAATQHGLLMDPSLSTLSLEQRANEAGKQFNDAFAKTMGGDTAAAAQLGSLAQAYLAADMAFEHGNATYAGIFSDVMSKLGQAQQFAGQQVTIEQLQLNALNAILQTLQKEQNALNKAASPNYNAADAKSLTGDFGSALAASGMSESDFLHSASGAPWIAARNQLIAGTTDPALLYADLAAARQQAQNPGMADIGNDYGSKVMAQLNALGIPVPSYDVGTPYVPRTGLAMLHQGERVVTASDNSGFAGDLKGLRAELAALRAIVTAGVQAQLAQGAQVVENTRRAADAPYESAVLNATNDRTKVLT